MSTESGAGHAGIREIAAVILLLAGGVLVPVLGWLAGVALLWTSPRWRVDQKVFATLVWPGGLLAPIVVLLAGGGMLFLAVPLFSCSCPAEVAGQPPCSCGPPGGLPLLYVFIASWALLVLLAIAGPVFTAVRLLRAMHTTTDRAGAAT